MSELKRTQLYDVHVAAGATMVDFGGWEMPIEYPAKIVAVGKKNVTINMTAEEVQEDDIFDVIEAGEPMVDPDTGAFLGNDGDDVGRIRITRPGPMSSKAVPEDDLDLDDIEVGYIVRRVSAETLKKEAKKKKAKAQEAFESRF